MSENIKGILSTLPHWWLSFCDASKPEGSQFLGALVVPGDSICIAVVFANSLGINPGGEVAGVPIDREMFTRIPESYRCRLLTRAECETLDREMLS